MAVLLVVPQSSTLVSWTDGWSLGYYPGMVTKSSRLDLALFVWVTKLIVAHKLKLEDSSIQSGLA